MSDAPVDRLAFHGQLRDLEHTLFKHVDAQHDLSNVITPEFATTDETHEPPFTTNEVVVVEAIAPEPERLTDVHEIPGYPQFDAVQKTARRERLLYGLAAAGEVDRFISQHGLHKPEAEVGIDIDIPEALTKLLPWMTSPNHFEDYQDRKAIVEDVLMDRDPSKLLDTIEFLIAQCGFSSIPRPVKLDTSPWTHTEGYMIDAGIINTAILAGRDLNDLTIS